ncbi:Protein of unknown function [Marinactinospora thermotolerans DSM 45154]|uniref:DUF742 domain-containing protein n=2 Tax=Marinactinospora thermotolerans TaxID=531310 RepID=A0A1T4SJN2_9ACTN|nr:Protein of unknown function [Marinactinospora thermotolerans DSM 45154]
MHSGENRLGALPSRLPRGADEGAEPQPGDSLPDAAAGPLVRPYTMTGGRTRPGSIELDLISVVVAARQHVEQGTLEPEHEAILQLCRRPLSVAEISAHLDIPLTVIKVLLGDLISRGAVLARAPLPTAQPPQMNVLQAVLDGIRRL